MDSSLFSFHYRFAAIAAVVMFSHAEANAAVSYTIDAAGPNDLTIVLKDFNGSGPDHTALTSNPGVGNAPIYEGNQEGYARYSTNANASDPRVIFNNTPAYDVNQYNYVRVRLKASATATSEMWPNNPVGPTTIPLGSVGTTFTEIQRAWVNPGNGSIVTSTAGGFRWDPIAGTNPLTFDLDYFMVDRGRVIGFEFDSTIAAMSSSYQGWQPNSGFTTHSVSGGSLRGTNGESDPYIQNTSLSVNSSIYKFAEIRMRADAGTALQIFWSDSTANFTEGKSIRPVDTDGEWHTYMLDFTTEATWTGTIDRFRIDIGSNTAANPAANFEIDYIRFREFGVIPEPSRVALFVLAGTAIILRRRRSSLS